jgi:hypothetical protein
VSISSQITREIHENGILLTTKKLIIQMGLEKNSKASYLILCLRQKKLSLQRTCLASYGLDNLQDYTDYNEQSRHIIGSSYVDWKHTQHESPF